MHATPSARLRFAFAAPLPVGGIGTVGAPRGIARRLDRCLSRLRNRERKDESGGKHRDLLTGRRILTGRIIRPWPGLDMLLLNTK